MSLGSGLHNPQQQERKMQPTTDTYLELQRAFTHFNKELFDGEIPNCLITLQREKNVFGYFSQSRFINATNKIKADEIAMNPYFFSIRPPKDTLSTLVHEMVHAWQCHKGDPGRRGYHNKEWADKMEKIGLMPSDTREPGGRKVGEQVSHYIIEGGPFDKACDKLLTKEFKLQWGERLIPFSARLAVAPGLAARIAAAQGEAQGEEGEAQGEEGEGEGEGEKSTKTNRSNRVKYRCPRCGAQVWGKPGLRLLCNNEESCNHADLEVVG
jgi:predicted SprT family Zn-dependent metalloprotease